MRDVEWESPEIPNRHHALVDSGDNTYLSAIVDKVYRDLLALSIPLTPSNVTMYIEVLDKEKDFYPFNRVDIVQKYFNSALAGGGDLVAGAFNSREKTAILSEFAYGLFLRSSSYFTDKDWSEFCANYMEETLSAFPATDLLRSLEETRLLVRHDDRLYFKYSFFLSFLVGQHIADHPTIIKEFLEGPMGYVLEGVMETIVGLTGDGTDIIDHITSDLEDNLNEFTERFIPSDFDPLAKLEWLVDNDDKLWEGVNNEIERGPVPTSELDLMRTSFRGEARTIDQEVRYSRMRELEIAIFHIASILAQTLKASHGVRGTVKRRALLSYLRTDQIGMQVGTILARELAKADILQWGGATFIGFNRAARGHDDDQAKELAIVIALPSSVITKSVNEIASKKLGEAFRIIISEQDPGSFLSLLLFGCLIRTKPAKWEQCARDRIDGIGRKSFYLSQILDILMDDYKTGINTLQERESLKVLIATVHAKRSHGKVIPSAKLIKGVLRTLKNNDILTSKGEET